MKQPFVNHVDSVTNEDYIRINKKIDKILKMFIERKKLKEKQNNERIQTPKSSN